VGNRYYLNQTERWIHLFVGNIGKYFYFYNHEGPHQSLSNQTPFEVYQAGLKTKEKKEPKEPIFDQEKLSQKVILLSRQLGSVYLKRAKARTRA
jgi:hypothetical protein